MVPMVRVGLRRRGQLDQLAIDLAERVDRGLDQLVQAVDDRQARQRLGDHGAGDVAGLMSAHAVGHRPQPAIGADEDRSPRSPSAAARRGSG